MTKVAVIGAGIFGSTVAIELSESGMDVDLFEKNTDILSCASGINQYRLHKGYHYPRSLDTIASCKSTTPLFEKYYKEAILENNKHFYAIAKEKSKVSAEKYVQILEDSSLSYEIVTPVHINSNSVDVVVQVQENLFDPEVLRELIKKKIINSRIKLYLNTTATIDSLEKDYDYIVVASYAGINESLKGSNVSKQEYQYEVCEKIVIEIPDELKGISTVVMDGPFMSFDPLGKTGYAVMGHVDHAIHHWNIGEVAEVPDHIKPYLNKGIIPSADFSFSRGNLFLETGSEFMPMLEKSKHIGSMFTIRTVLPRVDASDTRPTIVNLVDQKIITVYSGKIGNSVKAAQDVVSLIKK